MASALDWDEWPLIQLFSALSKTNDRSAAKYVANFRRGFWPWLARLQRQLMSIFGNHGTYLAHANALLSLDVKEQLAPNYCSRLRMVRDRGFEPLTPTVSR